MGILTKTKTWRYIVNQRVAAGATLADSQRGLFVAMKDALKVMVNHAAQVVGSCNSATYGMDGVDRILGPADVVHGDAVGAPRSWLVLRFPGIAPNFQLLLWCGTSGPSQLYVVASNSAGFTGGTLTARPTAVDEYAVLDGGAFMTSATAAASIVWHLMHSSDGKHLRVVAHINGVVVFSFMLETVLDTEPWWEVPVAVCWKGTATPSTASPGVGYNTHSDVPGMRAFAGGAFDVFITSQGYKNAPVGKAFAVPNGRTGKWHPSEMGVASETVTPVDTRGVHGKLVDLWWGHSSGVVEGSTSHQLDAPGTVLAEHQYVQFGHMVFPWNGTVPVVA